jgi:quinol monooxygenase YgiN
MPVAKYYIMRPREGLAEAVEDALNRIADAHRAAPGCIGIDLMREADGAGRYIMVQHFTDADSNMASARNLPRDAVMDLMAAVDGQLEGSYFEAI